jgi:Zn-dependent peptidase ImmA (M78 family)
MQLPRAEVLTYEQVARRAAEFLAGCDPQTSVPVDIERIVERMGLDIVPIPGLKTAYDVDGFLTKDMREIRVDQEVMMTTEVRYRFTLAHELAHLVLHADAFREIDLADVDEWFVFRTALEDDWFDKQANWFAGALLVPRSALLVEYQEALAAASLGGADVSELSAYSRMTIAAAIADHFNVSAQVVHIRLEKLGLY